MDLLGAWHFAIAYVLCDTFGIDISKYAKSQARSLIGQTEVSKAFLASCPGTAVVYHCVCCIKEDIKQVLMHFQSYGLIRFKGMERFGCVSNSEYALHISFHSG